MEHRRLSNGCVGHRTKGPTPQGFTVAAGSRATQGSGVLGPGANARIIGTRTHQPQHGFGGGHTRLEPRRGVRSGSRVTAVVPGDPPVT